MAKRRGHGEGTVYRRKDRPNLWFAAVDVPTDDGVRRRKVLSAPTRRGVLAKLDAAREKLRKGLPVDDDPQTVGDFLTAWLSDIVKTTKSPNTWKAYEAKVRLYLAPRRPEGKDGSPGPYLPAPHLGGLKLATLQPRHVQAAVRAWQEAGKPAAAVRYAIDVLQTALAHAERQEFVVRNVAALVALPQVEAVEIEPLDRAGVERFLEQLVGHRLEALFRVALALGIREGEVLGLRRQDIDLEKREVQIRVQLQWNPITKRHELVPLKTPKSRRDLVLPDFAVRAFRSQFARQAEDRLHAGEAWENWEAAGLVFTNEIGHPIDSRRLRREMGHLRSAAGLPTLRFHDSRHTCATFLLAQGVPERVAMAILGHTNPSMTRRYQHVPAELRQQAADLIDAVLGRQSDMPGQATAAGEEPR